MRGNGADGECILAISTDTLTSERDALKTQLRELEAEQRRIESELKKVRQKELRTKREIEALSTLLDLTAEPTADDIETP